MVETAASAAFHEALMKLDELDEPVEENDPGDILGADKYYRDEED